MENKNKNKVSENVYSMIPLMLKYKIKQEKLKKLTVIISGEENVGGGGSRKRRYTC